MTKKAQAFVGVSAILLILLVGFGSYKVITENRYVGDASTHEYYDLAKCDVSNLNHDNLINFSDLSEAEKNGYIPAKCSNK